MPPEACGLWEVLHPSSFLLSPDHSEVIICQIGQLFVKRASNSFKLKMTPQQQPRGEVCGAFCFTVDLFCYDVPVSVRKEVLYAMEGSTVSLYTNTAAISILHTSNDGY